MVTIEFQKYKCPHCGKEYEDSVRSHFPKKPCKQCTQLMMKWGQLQQKLLAEEFSIEQEDVTIAKQINDLLLKENISISPENETLLGTLSAKLLQDEKRRKRIIKQIIRIQRAKQ